VSNEYSEQSFWDKLAKYAIDAGKEVVLAALKLYFATLEKSTPAWAQAVAIAALAYFISPIDAIPDFTPVIGYADDAGVLTTALGTLATYITDDINRKSQNKLQEWF
jgi:uncharacterized membrane protein YkvA (DUF1232 family)